MNRVRRVLSVMLCSFPIAAVAQENLTPSVVAAAAPVEKIRFAGAPSSVQMRIEVLSPGGALVFDSDWKDGNILDWLPQDSSGQPLANGVYRLVMQSKNLAGQISEKETALHLNSGGMAIDDQLSASPKITLTAHDGETGQLITTSGDLSFRFGDFLNRKDIEAMRLTSTGDLNVNGFIRAKGIVLPDGTILTTAKSVMREHPSIPNTPNRGLELRPPILPMNLPAASAARRTPQPNFTPDFQFKVTDTGVNVGTTNPAYRLDVTGVVNTATEYDIGFSRFAHKFGDNIFVGTLAGNFTMTGFGNTGIGNGSLAADTSGFRNTASGSGALASNTTGTDNTASGSQALTSNTSGFANAAFGFNALFTNTNGFSNVANGYSALVKNTSGNGNTAIGVNTLNNNTTGSSNLAIGAGAGSALTAGNNNIYIGNGGVASEDFTSRIGAVQTRAFIAGIRGVTTGAQDAVNVLIDSNGQLGTASSSIRYKFDIADMADASKGLMKLRPVTFRYITYGANARLQYGLIAEEVAEVYPELATRNKDGEVETVMYQFLAPMLLNEVQKQHRQIEEQRAENATLRDQLQRLMQRVERLEGKRSFSE